MRSKYLMTLTLWLLALGASLPGWSAPKSNTVQVQFQQTDTQFQVVLRFNAPVTPPPIRFYGKQSWVYVDVPAGLVGKAKVQRVRQGGILWARYGWYKARPPITRIWVATNEKRPAEWSQQDDGRTLVLSVWKQGHTPQSTAAPESPPVVTPQSTPLPAVQRDRPALRPLRARVLPEDAASSPEVAIAPAEPTTLGQVEPVAQPAEPAGTSKTMQVASQREERPAPAARPSLRTRPAAEPARPAPVPRVTVDFVGAEIADVLKALALQTQTNIVTSPEVKGNVTVSLSGVTVEEALDLITRLSGYRYAKVGTTYVVATAQGLQALLEGTQSTTAQPRVTQVVAYRYVNPESLSKVLQERAPGAQVFWDLTSAQATKGAGTRVALVSGAEAEVRVAAELIESVDTTLSQSQQEMVVDTYIVKHASPSDLRTIVSEMVPEVTIILGPRPGFNLLAPAPIGDSAGRTVGEKGVDMALQGGGGAAGAQQGVGNQQQGGGGSGDPSVDERVNTLVLMGPRASVERAKEALARIDVAPPQILIEARVVEISADVDNTLGVLWDFSATRANFSLGTPNPPDRGNVGTIVFGRLTRDAINVSAKLDALFKDNKARLLANPKLLVLNAKQAQIFIGDEVRYIESVQSTQNGVTVTTGRVNVGIQLNVAAKTNPEGDITLQIHPEVSLITGFLKTPVGGEIPQVSRRFADSTVRLRSGETLVIGGLLSQRDLRLVQKVPLLGDLPILGYLFKQTNTKRSNTEIMVFLTATLWKE